MTVQEDQPFYKIYLQHGWPSPLTFTANLLQEGIILTWIPNLN